MRDLQSRTNSLPAVLVVDDEPDFLRGLARSIPKELNYRVLTAKTGLEALELLEKQAIDLVLTDVRMPDMDGISLLEEIKSRDPWITVVVMTAYGSIESAIQAIKKGAYDFVQKPFTPDEINLLLKKALERNNLVRENLRLKNRLDGNPSPDLFVCGGPKMRRLLQLFRTVAALNVTVLIRGESGTGKEFAARYIHLLSPRSDRRMVTVNCPTLPEPLLESELFGYAKGAFTGAYGDKKGLIREADGSTLFLDEVGDIPLTIQTKLLRLIQEKEIKPLGISTEQSVDVRIVASTNRDLEAKISDKSFREDLFYRLNVVSVFMPPLRDIPDDIPILAQCLVQEAASEFELAPKTVSVDAMKYLMSRPWPGNIRELRNVIQRAMIFSKSDQLQLMDFEQQSGFQTSPENDTESEATPYRTARDQLLSDFTKGYLTEALIRHGGNISAAARGSGLERQHFQKLMRKLGLRSNQFKN